MKNAVMLLDIPDPSCIIELHNLSSSTVTVSRICIVLLILRHLPCQSSFSRAHQSLEGIPAHGQQLHFPSGNAVCSTAFHMLHQGNLTKEASSFYCLDMLLYTLYTPL